MSARLKIKFAVWDNATIAFQTPPPPPATTATSAMIVARDLGKPAPKPFIRNPHQLISNPKSSTPCKPDTFVRLASFRNEGKPIWPYSGENRKCERFNTAVILPNRMNGSFVHRQRRFAQRLG